jgi:trans-2,3-dihydro-3-hydroxyanthranilate isomerase
VADAGRWKSVFGGGAEKFCAAYVYSKETVDAAHHVHARMFTVFPTPWEDPATGSAVAAFSGAAVAFEQPGDGTHQIVIEQGYEMGRPSQIVLDMDVQGGHLTAARIGGAAVMISEGVLTF